VKGLPAPGPMRVRRVELLGRPAVLLRMPVDGSRAWAKGRLEAVFLINPQDVLLLKSYIERITFTAMGAVLATALLLYPVFRSLHQRVVRLLEDAVRSNLETASVLGAAIAVRDSDTGSHNFRVALYALRMGETLGEGSLDMVSLILGAFLHDVGKIGIRDEILLKPGPLTEAETLVMRTHVQRGLDIIGSSQWLQLARRVVGGHHERFDGTGYPAGLKGEDIPLEARIFAIIDVFDALTSQRPYHRAMGFEEAMALLEGQAGRHFDPVLLAAFQRVAREAHRDLGAATEAELMERLMKEVDRRRPELYAAEMVSTATPAGWGPQLPLPSLDLTRPVTK
jgi:HD-GYP domain-containing protein (c-di-GMP phosphodiesterase class II)